jgi:hypothetical protein
MEELLVSPSISDVAMGAIMFAIGIWISLLTGVVLAFFAVMFAQSSLSSMKGDGDIAGSGIVPRIFMAALTFSRIAGCAVMSVYALYFGGYCGGYLVCSLARRFAGS